MSAWSAAEAVQRLSCCDQRLEYVRLEERPHTDEDLAELGDCLLAHPDIVKCLYLNRNHLTDKTGIKLAQYLAASTTIEVVNMSQNRFSEVTYLAVAAALRVNKSLRAVNMSYNRVEDQTRIDAAFADALRLNSDRPSCSMWLYLGDWVDVDYKRLKDMANQLGHPSLQMLLVWVC